MAITLLPVACHVQDHCVCSRIQGVQELLKHLMECVVVNIFGTVCNRVAQSAKCLFHQFCIIQDVGQLFSRGLISCHRNWEHLPRLCVNLVLILRRSFMALRVMTVKAPVISVCLPVFCLTLADVHCVGNLSLSWKQCGIPRRPRIGIDTKDGVVEHGHSFANGDAAQVSKWICSKQRKPNVFKRTVSSSMPCLASRFYSKYGVLCKKITSFCLLCQVHVSCINHVHSARLSFQLDPVRLS